NAFMSSNALMTTALSEAALAAAALALSTAAVRGVATRGVATPGVATPAVSTVGPGRFGLPAALDLTLRFAATALRLPSPAFFVVAVVFAFFFTGTKLSVFLN